MTVSTLPSDSPGSAVKTATDDVIMGESAMY